MNSSIGILGGGMSGLWLAKKLKEYNPKIKVIIYEKENIIGGKFILENGFLTGAEQIHFENYFFYNYVKNLLIDKDINKYIYKLKEPIIFSKNKNIKNSDFIRMINSLDELSFDEKTIFLCHEYSMELKNIDKQALRIEIDSLNKKLGTESYIISKKLYKLIIKDLTKNLEINFKYNKKNIKNHNAIVNAYIPKSYLTNIYPCIKIFFRNKELLNVYNNISDNYLYCMDHILPVCELWRNEDYFTIFATASRADILNNLDNKELKNFIEKMILNIFNLEINIKNVYKKYWKHGYHHPNLLDRDQFKENRYSCGEWLSPIFDASINSAMSTAETTLKQLIDDKVI
jgi:hypothetical protein